VATLSAAAARVTEPMEAVDPMLDGPAAAAAIPSTLRLLRTAAADAGAAVYQASLGDPTLSGMGTTLTAALYDGDKLHLIHAGDSRCYLFRDGALRQLTDDHTWIAEQVRTGAMTEAEAKESRFRHVITRSIGFERQIDVDTRSLVVEPGDCLVLCSDGMSNYIDGLELERLVATTWYRKLPQLLVDAANQRGGGMTTSPSWSRCSRTTCHERARPSTRGDRGRGDRRRSAGGDRLWPRPLGSTAGGAVGARRRRGDGRAGPRQPGGRAGCGRGGAGGDERPGQPSVCARRGAGAAAGAGAAGGDR
jgi:hypothetical protein